MLEAVLDAGVDRVGLADTVGYADPAMVSALFTRAFRIAGERLACGHFHDTRGLGIANVMAAWQTGIARFDACLAGIGGARTRHGRAATSRPRISLTCSPAWVLLPGSTSIA